MSEQVFDAPILSVTLLEDRARVVRRGVLTLEGAGRIQLAVPGVSPVLVDKSLAVRIFGTDQLVVADARAIRKLVPQPEIDDSKDDEPKSDRAEIVTTLRARRKQEALMTAEAELTDAEADGLARLAGATLADLADDVSRGREFDANTVTRLDSLRERERELRVQSARAWHEIGQHTRASERLQNRLDTMSGPATVRECTLRIDLEARQAGEASIEFEYVVPAAMWRPAHTATLLTTNASSTSSETEAELATSACVWQNTGEDWNDVDLLFSTERASLGAEPPVLQTDRLRVKKRQDQLVVEAREKEVQTLSGSGEVETASHLPGIDDGGQIVSLRSPHKVSVVSDGRPHRIPLSSFTAPVSLELWAYPEISSSVVYRSKLVNRGEVPVLAGPVELLREGGWVGRTAAGYVAVGEEFELSWGPEPALRIRREETVNKEESRALSSWSSRERKVEVRVSNLGREPLSVSVRERIPVSEIEKVKIEYSKKDATDGVVPDDDGFVTWTLDLKPQSNRRLELRYTTKRHSDVVGA